MAGATKSFQPLMEEPMPRPVSPFGSREDQERFRKLKPLEQLQALEDLIEQVEKAPDEAERTERHY
jgi:hypothetical protein